MKQDRRLQAALAAFKERVYNDPVGILDAPDVHHEFASGHHGRKLDYDKIERNTDFYIEWVALYARTILDHYGNDLPDILVGIANGANRLSVDVAGLLGAEVLGLQTRKTDGKTVVLDDASATVLKTKQAGFVLLIEDVGTTGGTCATAAEDVRKYGVKRIESVCFHQRSQGLPRLEAIKVPYWAVLLDPLPTFSAEACRSLPEGYCAHGVKLIAHGK
jgi:hypothetical protein